MCVWGGGRSGGRQCVGVCVQLLENSIKKHENATPSLLKPMVWTVVEYLEQISVTFLPEDYFLLNRTVTRG